jgi:two-component system, chemotaxis family, response regulator Rcp1
MDQFEKNKKPQKPNDMGKSKNGGIFDAHGKEQYGGKLMGRPIEILLVEDNPGDVRLTMEALKEGRVTNHLQIAMDGEEAMDILRRQGKYSDAVRPDLILLDLNLPKKDGREVLVEIKSDDLFKTIPVVVLTMSKAEEDILRTYLHHANCYITKPIDMDQFLGVMKQIENFWLTVVKLPSRLEFEK